MRAKEFITESTEREIAQAQYMQGECAVLALTIRNMNPQRFTLGFVYEFFDSSPDMYLEPDEFDELDPARQQEIQYNHENWTLTHAYVYDVKTKEYIDAEGRHKQLPMIGRSFNSTRHNKFPAETQDLVNVSHHMEYDEAQEKWIVLQGWDALDKAYTPEDKQRAREYAIKYLGIDPPAQAVAEEINPDCFDPAFNDTQVFDGLTYRATVDKEYGKPVLTIKVLDDNFQQAGLAKFKQSTRGVVSLITSFRPEYQGQGLARNIYAYVRSLGNTIVPSRNQLPPGKAMWDSWKKSGDAKYLMKDVAENFADGQHPEDKGDSVRHGIPKGATMAELEKASHAAGRKGQLARWQLNMRRGKKKTNETVIGTLHFPKLIIAVDDHAIDRTRTRGISPATIDQSLRKLNGIADQLGQMESSNTVWVYDVSNNIALGLRRTSSQGMQFTLKTVVADRPFDGTTPIIELT